MVVVVEAVADDEQVFDIEADVFAGGGEGGGDFFSEEDAGTEGAGAAFGDFFADEADGAAGVEDVIDDEDMLAFKIGGQGSGELGALALLSGAGVTADGDDADADFEGEFAHEVGDEDDGAGEDGDEDDFTGVVGVGEVVADLVAEFFDAFGDLLSGDDDFFDVGEHGEKVSGNR